VAPRLRPERSAGKFRFFTSCWSILLGESAGPVLDTWQLDAHDRPPWRERPTSRRQDRAAVSARGPSAQHCSHTTTCHLPSGSYVSRENVLVEPQNGHAAWGFSCPTHDHQARHTCKSLSRAASDKALGYRWDRPRVTLQDRRLRT
jgi:hypothetical protein